MNNTYVYVFVRKDIPLADQLVQVGHVCLIAGEKYGVQAGQSNLVLLQVKDTDELLDVQERLRCQQQEFVTFTEPDDSMGETTVCTTALPRGCGRRWKLWTP